MRIRLAVLSAAVAAAWLAPAVPAYAQDKGLEVRLSGQVNRALMSVDDGTKSNWFFVDNDISSTRFRLSATAPIMSGLTAGAVWENEFQSNASNEVSMFVRDVTPRFLERHADIFLQGGWGKVSLGQGSGAADGGIEVDLSGTTVAQWSGADNIGGAFEFNADGLPTGVTVSDTINNQDFESRYDRLRYDSPRLGGFGIAVSTGSKASADVHEIGLTYTGDMGGLGRLAGALGFSKNNTSDILGDDIETTGGSVSWLHGSGFNVTLAHSRRDFGSLGEDGKFTYAKLGYKFGRHAVSLDWGKGEDIAIDGVEGDMVGVGYVWAPAAWADIYAAIKRHGAEGGGTDADNITFMMVGTRIKF
jgi:predicted porin